MRYLKSVLNKVLEYKYRHLTPLEMRHDDIYLVSFPKSGNTWLSFLLANAIHLYLKKEIEINFFNIHFFVPDIHNSRNIPTQLNSPPFRRIIKSHSEYNSYYKNVFLVVRDPRDTMISYWYFLKGIGIYHQNLSSFIRDRNYGIESWVRHTASWLESPSMSIGLKVIRYEDLKLNAAKELSRLFKHMGVTLDDEILEKAVELSSFEKMKVLELETISYLLKKKEDFKFVRKGISKQYESEFSPSDREYVEKIAGKYMTSLGYTY